ncbi:MAG: hypothetical protein ACYTG5_10295 [Planctomycetota bacterium]
MLVGTLAVITYPLHLLLSIDPLGVDPLGEASGFSYYIISTFGAMAIVWGLALWLSAGLRAGRRRLAVPSAIGFSLLAIMRLLTIPFGAYVFHFLPSEFLSTALPTAEFVLFTALALGFWRVRNLADSTATVGESLPSNRGELGCQLAGRQPD